MCLGCCCCCCCTGSPYSIHCDDPRPGTRAPAWTVVMATGSGLSAAAAADVAADGKLTSRPMRRRKVARNLELKNE